MSTRGDRPEPLTKAGEARTKEPPVWLVSLDSTLSDPGLVPAVFEGTLTSVVGEVDEDSLGDELLSVTDVVDGNSAANSACGTNYIRNTKKSEMARFISAENAV